MYIHIVCSCELYTYVFNVHTFIVATLVTVVYKKQSDNTKPIFKPKIKQQTKHYF